MSTFQAIIFGIIQGFSEFLPVSASGHHVLVPELLGWPQPTGVFSGVLALGSLLSVLIYFRHDWASMISSVLQILLFRRRPMTLDERIPMFVAAACVPMAVIAYFVHERLHEIEWSAIPVAISLAAFAIPMWLADHFSRKNKGTYDWNWVDGVVVGLVQAAALVPGAGQLSMGLTGGLFRNYRREAAAKFALFCTAPILAVAAFTDLRAIELHTGAPMADLSWLSFAVALVVTTLTGILAIGMLMKHVQRKGMGQYVAYRLFLAAGVAGVTWWRSRA